MRDLSCRVSRSRSLRCLPSGGCSLKHHNNEESNKIRITKTLDNHLNIPAVFHTLQQETATEIQFQTSLVRHCPRQSDTTWLQCSAGTLQQSTRHCFTWGLFQRAPVWGCSTSSSTVPLGSTRLFLFRLTADFTWYFSSVSPLSRFPHIIHCLCVYVTVKHKLLDQFCADWLETEL